MTITPYDLNDTKDRLARIRYHGHTLIKRREDLGESVQRLNCLYEIYDKDGSFLVTALDLTSAKEYIDSGHNEIYL